MGFKTACNPKSAVMPAPVSAVLLASLAMHFVPVPAAAQVVVTPVAITGGAAPSGGDYRGLGENPALNASGQVAFFAGLTGGSATGNFVGSPGSLATAALAGSAAPAGGNYASLFVPQINASGQVAFIASLTGGSAGSGIFAGAPGSMQAAALKGSASPGGGGTYNDFFGAPALNAAGQVTFLGLLTGGTSSQGIFVGAPGSVQAAALVGAAAPAGGTYTSFGGGFPSLNSAGQVAFSASLTGGSSNTGIFKGTPGSLQAVALQGSAAPAGGNYGDVSQSPGLNAAGQVAFTCDLTGGSSTDGVFVGVPGSVQTVALAGTAAPAGGNYSDFGGFGAFVNHSGQVAFYAHLTGGSSTSGIFVGAPGAVQATALQGLLAPSGNGATFNDFLDLAVNASGQVVFIGLLTGAGVTAGVNDRGLYAGHPGSLVQIVRLGDLIDEGNGSGLHTVSTIGTFSGSGVEDGRNRIFNDSGELVYQLSFTDGTSGIFTSIIPVPEPSSLLLVAAGVGIGVGMRRRRFLFRRSREELLVGLLVAFTATPADAQVLLVVNGNVAPNPNSGPNLGTVGAYDAVTGATINAAFVDLTQGLYLPNGIARGGANRLFVGNIAGINEYDLTTGATVGAPLGTTSTSAQVQVDDHNHLFGSGANSIAQYDATTGATINAHFIDSPSQHVITGAAIDARNNHIFMAIRGLPSTVAEYDATTGAVINGNFITGISVSNHGFALDPLHNLLFMSNPNENTIAEYDSLTGATINAAFINGQGLNGPYGLTLDDHNHLFVANNGSNTVGEYDATTGATINAVFISGLNTPNGLLYVAPVPEPSSLLLIPVAASTGVGMWRRRWFGGAIACLAAFAVALLPGLAQAQPVLLICNEDPTNPAVGAYDAVTGATINSAFIGPTEGLGLPIGLARDGNNHLFVSNITKGVGEYDLTTGATLQAPFGAAYSVRSVVPDGHNHLFGFNVDVSQYDATTGAVVNAHFVTNLPGAITGMTLAGNNQLLVAVRGTNAVREYDATTGALINGNFITGVDDGYHYFALDALRNLLYMTNGDSNIVGEYDATTGATVNANFINGQGLNFPADLALDGKNHLFVVTSGAVGEYDATTGATLNSAFIAGLNRPAGLLYVAPVPEPSSLLLIAVSAGIGVGIRRRNWFGGATACLAAVAIALLPGLAQARQVLFAGNGGNNTVGAYNALTGATINANFIGPAQGLNQPWAMALDGNSHLLVANNPSAINGWVGQYNATTGATINANFLTVPAGQSIDGFTALAVDGNNHVFAGHPFGVAEYDVHTGSLINWSFISFNGGSPESLALDTHNHILLNVGNTVAQYDATTGTLINSNFVTPALPGGIRGFVLDALNHLLVAQLGANTVVGEYDATTGAAINPALITGQSGIGAWGISLDDNNHLFWINLLSNSISEFDAISGATINPAFINGQGLSGPKSVLFMSVPEPSSLLLVTAAAGVGLARRRGRKSAGSCRRATAL
jgi:hypothetical protein